MPERVWRASLVATVATLALTVVHHVYGGILYDTPWRIHGVALGVLGLVIAGVAYRRRSRPAWARGYLLTSGLLFGVVVGLFEGGYNHAVKDALFAVRLDPATLARLFPPHPWVAPDDALFEVTGVLQLPLGVVVVTLAGVLWSTIGADPSGGFRRGRRPRRR